MYHVVSSEETKIGRFRVIMQQIEKGGQLAPFSYVKIRPGVTLIPILENGNILVQKNYRHPVGKWEYEFLSGTIDEGESPEKAVARELHEETGCILKEFISLGSFYPSFGSTDEIIYMFVGKVLVPQGLDITDDSDVHDREILEEIRLEEKTVEEITHMILTDEFRMGAGLAAWLKWQLKENIENKN